ncbi:MAG: addiction module protein [Desulfacinum sp.]|jgi:putative addiction module component (TIGR02574 family)|nr:addiction module protein [Desulfacinum sp.]
MARDDLRGEMGKLSLSEKILLVQDLWDSIAGDAVNISVSESQKAELDKRISSWDASPGEGSEWPEVYRRVKSSK